MKNSGLLKMNIIATVLSLIFAFLFLCFNLFELIDLGRNMAAVILIGLFAVSVVILYFGSIIQGFRSIANGRARAIFSAAIWQLLLTIPNIAAILAIKNANKNSVLTFVKKETSFFLIVFVILLFLSVIRILKTNDVRTEAQMYTGSSKAVRTIILCVTVPISFVTLILVITKALVSLVEGHPMVGYGFTGIIALIFIAPIVVLFFVIFNKMPGSSDSGKEGGSTPVTSASRRPETLSRSRKTVKTGKSDDSAIVEALEKEYAERYKQITGDYPWNRDFMIMKGGPMKNAVLNLQKEMRNKARKLGVAGKNTWF